MDKETRPKRYFWRRLTAFSIDFGLAYAVAVVVLMGLDAVTGGQVYYWNGFATRTACAEAPPSALLDEVNARQPVRPGWTRGTVVCEQQAVGGKAWRVLSVSEWMQDGTVAKTSSFSIPVSNAGDRFDSSLKLDPTAVVAYVVMLVWAWRVGRSPGKRWLGLVVQPVVGADAVGSRLLQREWLRLGPLALLSLIEVVLVLGGWWFVDSLPTHLRLVRFFFDNMIVLTVLPTALALPAAIYYALPLLRWRGQAFYDRLAGTMVTRG